jgi:cytochrome c oxidase subunit 2
MKKLGLLAMMLVFAFAIAACGDKDDNKNTASPSPSASTAPQETGDQGGKEGEPTGKVVEITLEGSNFKFDKEEIKANVGDTVKITYKNKVGGHAVEFGDFDVKVNAGETKEFVVTKAGSFEYHCAIMCGVGHDKMVGELVVS